MLGSKLNHVSKRGPRCYFFPRQYNQPFSLEFNACLTSIQTNTIPILEIISCMCPAHERRRYNVMSSLIGLANAHNGQCSSTIVVYCSGLAPVGHTQNNKNYLSREDYGFMHHRGTKGSKNISVPIQNITKLSAYHIRYVTYIHYATNIHIRQNPGISNLKTSICMN